MSRSQTLHLLLAQAQSNGFDLRRWYQNNINLEWAGMEDAVAFLATGNHYFALVFSHDFARAFWQKGAQMNFIVPAKTYSRVNGRGQVITINRKPFTRRTIKADVWKYHLRQMAVSDDPLRYLKRFLPTHEDLQPEGDPDEPLSAVS
ncbi:hypothetical protein ACFPT7_23670 [Acidicapsa dinghuensis]|uniref:Uncharacterized protein n=1 Tax=Acidicapsa dinghuensis TaxID=2218256 RepID=A0ABW1EM25_9BACT|nr:hypothetical protein [Acidicapsa dinghuensis]